MAFPSTFSDLQNAIINKLRLDPTNDLQKAKDWINQVYAQVCVETEANITFATMTLTSGSASYTLPSGVIRIKEMYVTPVAGQQSQPIQQTTLDYILRRRQSGGGTAVATGSVTHYALLGINDLEVYPTPAAADVLTIYYAALPTALSGSSDVPILSEPYASKLLEYGALAEGADFKDDPKEVEYRQMYDLWMRKYQAHLNRKKGGQPGQMNIWNDANYPPHDPSTDVRGWR